MAQQIVWALRSLDTREVKYSKRVYINSIKVAESKGIRGRYNKPIRDLKQTEIRRLIIYEGLSNQQISDRINVPLKTVERWVKDLYAHDTELLTHMNGEKESLTQVSIVRDRLQNHKQEILSDIARNPKAPFADRIKAWHLICELEAADMRLIFETAPSLMRSSISEVRRAIMLKKEEEEEEENEKTGFDLDIEEETSSSSKEP